MLSPVGNTSLVYRVGTKDEPQSMADAILEIASDCSLWAHKAIPISSNAKSCLKPDPNNPNSESFTSHEDLTISEGNSTWTKIKSMRDNLESNLLNKRKSGMDRQSACTEAVAEYLIDVIRAGVGNCFEKGILAGIFLKASIESVLEQKGFDAGDVIELQMKVSIEDNKGFNGDHTVCVLRYWVENHWHDLFVDPWIRGSIYKRADAMAVFDQHLNTDESTCFQEYGDASIAVNDKACIGMVMDCAKEVLGQEPQFAKLFAYT